MSGGRPITIRSPARDAIVEWFKGSGLVPFLAPARRAGARSSISLRYTASRRDGLSGRFGRHGVAAFSAPVHRRRSLSPAPTCAPPIDRPRAAPRHTAVAAGRRQSLVGARAQAHAGLREACEACGKSGAAELSRVVAASEFAASVLIQDPGRSSWVNEHWAPARRERRERRTRAAAPARRRERPRRSGSCGGGGGAKCCASPGATSPVAAAVRETLRDVSALADACIRAALAVRAGAAAGHLRRAARRGSGRRAELIVRRHGQARRPRAEFLLRHRPRASCSTARGETDGAARRSTIEDYFTALGARAHPPARRAHRGWLRVPGRHAPAAVRRQRTAGGEPRLARGLPAAAWPRLGALRLDQGARHRRRARPTRRANQEFVRPFVYRRYLDFGVFESLARA